MPTEMVTVDGELCDETPMAWKFVTDGGNEKDAVYLPKSLATWNPDEEDSVTGMMELPRWLAEKEGLV